MFLSHLCHYKYSFSSLFPRRNHVIASTSRFRFSNLVCSADKVREKTILYIGRIDKLTEPKRLEIVKKLKELDKPKLISKFHSILFSIGYEFPSSVSSLEIEDVYSHGREIRTLLLHGLLRKPAARYVYEGHAPARGSSSNSGSDTYLPGWNKASEEGAANQTTPSQPSCGVGTTGEVVEPPSETSKSSETSDAADKVEGKVMTEAETSTSLPISGAPLMAIIAVISIMLLVGAGLWLKRS